jgi:hypothetical protein
MAEYTGQRRYAPPLARISNSPASIAPALIPYAMMSSRNCGAELTGCVLRQ